MTVPASSTKTLVAAAALSFCAGSLYGWSALIPALKRSFEVTTEQAGMVFSLSILAFTVAVYLTPRMGQLANSLRNGSIFAALAALALSIAAISSGFLTFLIAFSAGFGFCSGAIYIIVLNCAGQSAKPRLVTAVMVALFGFGAAVFAPVLRVVSAGDTGLKALFIVCVCFAISAGFTLILTHGSVDHSRQATPPPVANESSPTQTELVVLLWLVFCLGSAAGLMTLGLAASVIENRGASVWLSGITLSGVAMGNTAGRLSVGLMDEKVRASLIVIAATLAIGIGTLVCGLSSSILFTSAGLIVIATGYGIVASGIPTLTQSIFGSDRFRHIFSIVFSAWGVAGLTAPWVAGKLFDLWGSYFPAFAGAFGVTLTALVLAILLHIKSNGGSALTR